MTFPHKWTQICWITSRHQINSLSFVILLLLINKLSFICEGQSCSVRIIFYFRYRHYHHPPIHHPPTNQPPHPTTPPPLFHSFQLVCHNDVFHGEHMSIPDKFLWIYFCGPWNLLNNMHSALGIPWYSTGILQEKILFHEIPCYFVYSVPGDYLEPFACS